MPAYLTHSIMGEEVHKKANDEKLFRVPVNVEDVKTFSIGVDFASLSKVSAHNSHNKDTRTFFLIMIDYIKFNKFMEDEKVMALLYGHIAHYFLDVNLHPLIYYYELGLKHCEKALPNHVFVEGYLSTYFCKKVLGIDYMKVKPTYFNQGSIYYAENAKLIRYVFDKTYRDTDIMFSYDAVLNFLTWIEKAIKSGLFSKDFLVKFSKYDEFLAKNGIESIYFTNPNSENWTHPVTGEVRSESIDMLYLKSINDTLEAIEAVNRYIYGIDKTSRQIESVFTDLSYDTGIDCLFGRNMVHILSGKK